MGAQLSLRLKDGVIICVSSVSNIHTYPKKQSVEYVKLDDVSVISWSLFPFLEKLSSLVCHNIMYLAHKHLLDPTGVLWREI